MTAAAVVVATMVSYVLALAIGVPLLVPLLNTLASYPFMVSALRRGRPRDAVLLMLVWALSMGVCATLIAYAAPWRASALFMRGGAYRAEMFTWIVTGRGAESTPSLFIPQHAGHAALFIVLALGTAGTLAMPMGAVLMNYMGTYVGSLAAASRHPAAVMLLGWHPWAVIRVASFVGLGVVLSAALLSRALGFEADWRFGRRVIVLAACGLVVDVALKAALAPSWQRLLLRVTGW
ncbi:MAG TPA: hypothetical protein VF219_05250 [Vicinamibacterales bacterium]